MTTPEEVERARQAANAALADAEIAINSWRDDLCEFLQRCNRLGKVDLISVDQVTRCVHEAAANQLIELRRQFYKSIGADIVVVKVTPEDVAAYEEWRARELEKRKWQG